ncbi:MAG: prepilin-type N-terminal cleavage/methylation domain-containing protein [Patescibacteria group bacterium]|nr:prepilin-type N-terminal cleavage/methylation domain-containing protein [Patescibacteria group bacterium]
MTRGFTLVELLIVIAILVVLSVAVVLVLNPAELIKQGRDSTRISDLSTLNSAIALYLADMINPNWATTTVRFCTKGAIFPEATATITTCLSNSISAVDGTGWVNNIEFRKISFGSPISRLPLDPLNTTSTASCPSIVYATTTQIGCFYGFRASTTVGVYEINANMESTKYKNGGAADVESKDGGNNDEWYEVGSNLNF